MEYRNLGSSNVKVSTVSFGCMTIPNLPADADEAAKIYKVAIDAGVNHFDNADIYDYGRAERCLARSFQKLGLKSTNYIIASKMGHFYGTAEHPYEPAHIRHQCEQSLINLKRDYIDLYYFHHGNFGPNDEYLPEAVATMDQLVKEGKVRLKGLSAYHVEHFERIVPVLRPSALQSWAHARDDKFVTAPAMAQLMEKYDLSFVAFSPLEEGILLDKFKAENPPQFKPGDNRATKEIFRAESLTKLRPKMDKLKARFGSTTEDLAATAINYVLALPRVACVIPGPRSEVQARCNLSGIGRKMSPEDVQFIRDLFAE